MIRDEWEVDNGASEGMTAQEMEDAGMSDSYDDGFHEKIILPSGAVYSGFLRKNKFHGLGKLVSRNGIVYEGSFYYNLKEGHGVLRRRDETDGDEDDVSASASPPISSTSIVRYEGDFYNDRKYGRGVATLANGDTYTGAFMDNRFHDTNATMRYSDGRLYEGSFVNGVRRGLGRLYKDGSGATSDYYEGSFDKGVLHGMGRYVWVASKREFSGEHKEGKKVAGRMVFADGKCYQGEWRNEKPHGNGCCLYKDGSVYVGSWKNGLMDGHGLLKRRDGSAIEGLFIADKPQDGEDLIKHAAVYSFEEHGMKLPFPVTDDTRPKASFAPKLKFEDFEVPPQPSRPQEQDDNQNNTDDDMTKTYKGLNLSFRPSDDTTQQRNRSATTSAVKASSSSAPNIQQQQQRNRTVTMMPTTTASPKGQRRPPVNDEAIGKDDDENTADTTAATISSSPAPQQQETTHHATSSEMEHVTGGGPQEDDATAHTACEEEELPPFPLTVLLSKGWMEKYSIGKSFFSIGNWKKRYFILSSTAGLGYYVSGASDAEALGCVPVHRPTTRLVTNPTSAAHKQSKHPELDIVIIFVDEADKKERKLLLRCSTTAEHDQWVASLSKVIKLKNLPSDVSGK